MDRQGLLLGTVVDKNSTLREDQGEGGPTQYVHRFTEHGSTLRAPRLFDPSRFLQPQSDGKDLGVGSGGRGLQGVLPWT